MKKILSWILILVMLFSTVLPNCSNITMADVIKKVTEATFEETKDTALRIKENEKDENESQDYVIESEEEKDINKENLTTETTSDEKEIKKEFIASEENEDESDLEKKLETDVEDDLDTKTQIESDVNEELETEILDIVDDKNTEVKDETIKVESETTKIEGETIEEEKKVDVVKENIATDSEIEEVNEEVIENDAFINDIGDVIATDSVIVKDITLGGMDVKISTISEIVKDLEIIATSSEITIATVSEITIATMSNIEKVLYTFNKVPNSAKLDGDKITLLKNVKLHQNVEITEPMIIDLNNYNIENFADTELFTIKGQSENSLIDVTLTNTNDIKTFDKLESRMLSNVNNLMANNEKSITISVENANVTITNVNIYAATRSVPLKIKNSNVEIDNAGIFGGNGYDYVDSVDDTNGASAVDLNYTSDKWTFTFNSGNIVGGTGGKNDKDDLYAMGGGVVSITDDKKGHGMILNWTEKGHNGTIGSGDGGAAIVIDDKKYIKCINVKACGIKGGDAGKVEEISNDSNILFGTDNLESYYDLRVGSSVGTTYTNVSELKNQDDTGLCSMFSATAAAETYMMKNYRSYLDEVFANDTHYANTKKASFSETHLVYYYYNHVDDPLKNAGASSTTLNLFDGYYWYDEGFSIYDYSISFPRRGVAINQVAPSQPISKLKNNTLSKNSPEATQYVAKVKSIKHVDISSIDLSTKITKLKKLIKENAGAVITMGMSGGWVPAIVSLDAADVSAANYYRTKYPDYVNDNVGVFEDSFNPGGHALFAVGWDDDFPKEFWPVAYRPKTNGAFIIKNSWDEWDFMSYEFANFDDYVTVFSYAPARDLQNTYYYDGGDSLEYFFNAQKIANVFTVKKNYEKLVSVSFVVLDSQDGKANVKIYKIPSGKDISNLTEANVVAVKTNLDIYSGVNYIDFTSSNVIMSRNEQYAVIVEDISGNTIYLIDADSFDYSGRIMKTTIMNKSFCYYNGLGWAQYTDFNHRIKMTTIDTTTAPSGKTSNDSSSNSSNSSSRINYGGGNSGGSSGGGGGGGISISQLNVANNIESNIGTVTKINNPEWANDGTYWHLASSDGVVALNGWYSVTDKNYKTDYYKFNNGIMLTGLTTENGSNYFLENDINSSNYGALSYGWKIIDNKYKYFGTDGRMLTYGKTPDNFIVDSEGTLIGTVADIEKLGATTIKVNNIDEALNFNDATVWVDPIWTKQQELLKQQEALKQQASLLSQTVTGDLGTDKIVIAASGTEFYPLLPMQILLKLIK